ncbi:death domain-associated protein 6-like, partial [Corapipo altera]|uniref:death domain-associated protein 6-like n=1 Tax=Corapipo altera TaxID=415028 RepID=UPI000FD64003
PNYPQVSPGIPRCIPSYLQVYPSYLQVYPGVPRYLQVYPRYPQVYPGVSRYPQVSPGAPPLYLPSLPPSPPSQFLSVCAAATRDHPEVLPFLRSRHARAQPEFRGSAEFRNILGRLLRRLRSRRSKTFVYINELCTVLKARALRRRLPLLPLPGGGGGGVPARNSGGDASQYPTSSSQCPGGSSQCPGGSSQYPDGLTAQQPNGTSRYPDGASRYPDGSTSCQDPGIPTHRPGDPDSSSHRSDGSSQRPSDSSQYPDDSSQYPDGSSQRPDGSFQYPDGSSQRPDGSSRHPDGSSQYPDGSSQYPDGSSQHPDGSSRCLDGSSQRPEGSSQCPDGSSQRLDGPSQHPDASSHHPDSSSRRPDPSPRRSGGSRRQIRYLENLLRVYAGEIRRLQERELDFQELDSADSPYLQENRLKRRMMRIFRRLCQLKECSSLTGRVLEQRIRFRGTRYPEVNRRIERFINRPDAFPDYSDILREIRGASERHGLGLARRHMENMAQEAFREVGNRLQERRHLDLVYNFGSHLTDQYRPG